MIWLAGERDKRWNKSLTCRPFFLPDNGKFFILSGFLLSVFIFYCSDGFKLEFLDVSLASTGCSLGVPAKRSLSALLNCTLGVLYDPFMSLCRLLAFAGFPLKQKSQNPFFNQERRTQIIYQTIYYQTNIPYDIKTLSVVGLAQRLALFPWKQDLHTAVDLDASVKRTFLCGLLQSFVWTYFWGEKQTGIQFSAFPLWKLHEVVVLLERWRHCLCDILLGHQVKIVFSIMFGFSPQHNFHSRCVPVLMFEHDQLSWSCIVFVLPLMSVCLKQSPPSP